MLFWQREFSVGLNSFQLKCIAMFAMVVDHIGAILFPQALLLRYIGRIAFPIFSFLLVEGYFHTRNIEKYILRLGIFACISEIPYDLAFRGNILDLEYQNVFFTLVLGVGMMYCLEKYREYGGKLICVLLTMWLANWLSVDYGYKGILLIAIYYFYREQKTEKMILGAGWNLLWGKIQSFGALATLFLMKYDGKKGRNMKYFFYVFYPIHLLLLYGINGIF